MNDNPYDRQQRIPGWRQQALTDATVVLVGVGAIGNEVARILTMAGVGRLILCDPDRVEVTNLSRTVLFRHRDADNQRLKVEAAARALSDLAPNTRVDPRPAPLVHGLGLAELREADLVVSCLDSRVARLQLAGRCGLVAAPWLDGGTSPWGGEVRPFLDPDGPCYGCALGAEQRAVVDAPWSCADVQEADPEGSSIVLSAAVGAWMGTLAIRFLMGLPCSPQLLRLDGAVGACVLIEQRRDSACPLHQRAGTPVPVPVHNGQTVSELLAVLPLPGTVLTWAPMQTAISCRACRRSWPGWGMAAPRLCPQCGGVARPNTTLELDQAPAEMSLSALGIAPREILSVRTDQGHLWVELAPHPAEQPD